MMVSKFWLSGQFTILLLTLSGCLAIENEMRITQMPFPKNEPETTQIHPEISTSNPEESVTENHIRAKNGMKMLFVPPGSFPMGNDENDSESTPAEHPQHEVTLDSFWIDETEISNAQYNLYHFRKLQTILNTMAGISAIGIGLLGIKGIWGATRSFEYQYSLSFIGQSSLIRTQQTHIDFAQSYTF
jgi:hypothetical protein